MRIDGIDHLYVETNSWETSVAFWTGLGFTRTSEWGEPGHRAGRFEAGSSAVVLAEVTDTAPVMALHFAVQGADGSEDLPGVVTPLADTHWGTQWIRVEDPDGRIHVLEQHA